ncbi:MAG: thiol-disulfide oxidoreductase DCC family protein [Sandaracinaceae bacterium]
MTESPLMLYDGECAMCCGSVQFVLDHEAVPALRFASFQGRRGQAELRRFGLPTEAYESFVIIEDGQAHIKMAASIRLMHHLGGFYRVLSRISALTPRFLGDAFYSLVFRNRKRIFGVNTTCRVPAPPHEARFEDGVLGYAP